MVNATRSEEWSAKNQGPKAVDGSNGQWAGDIRDQGRWRARDDLWQSAERMICDEDRAIIRGGRQHDGEAGRRERGESKGNRHLNYIPMTRETRPANPSPRSPTSPAPGSRSYPGAPALSDPFHYPPTKNQLQQPRDRRPTVGIVSAS